MSRFLRLGKEGDENIGVCSLQDKGEIMLTDLGTPHLVKCQTESKAILAE